MKMDSLNGLCYKMTEYDCYVTDHHEKVVSRPAAGGSNACRRKMTRWDTTTEVPNRSTGSLLTTMEHFVQTVDDMNETILVPCRLMDAKFDSPQVLHPNDTKARVLSNLSGVDLFQFYTILNSVKSDLMWGSKSHPAGAPVSTGSNTGLPPMAPTPASVCNSNTNFSVLAQSSTSSTSVISNGSGEVKGHKRRPSTVSTTSSASVSDTEFSELNDDSGVEGEEEYSQHMADSFHHHLTGLQQCLRDLTLAANYVTNRYNNDLGGA